MKRTNICVAIAIALTFGLHSAKAAVKYAKVGGMTSGSCNTWANACTLQYALYGDGVNYLGAQLGDSIWAKKTAGGSPYGPIELVGGVKIIGGFAGTETQASQSNPVTNVTTIDGGGTQKCLYSEGGGSSTVVLGFTISNCRNSDGGDWDGGGGALVLNNSDAVFVRCIFENNTSVRMGAAVGIRGTNSPQFFNCIFRNNGSGTSGAAQDDNVQPMAGGAVYLHSGSPVFVNCLFYGNKAAEGAVLANYGGTATFVNCALVGNYAKYGYGGAINDARAQTVMRNCVVWGNTAIKGGNQIMDIPAGTMAVTHSNVQGGFSGNGNIDSDPLFVNSSGGDYSVTTSSPCLDAGNGDLPADAGDLDWDNQLTEATSLDFAMVQRRVGLAIDIGPYEYQNPDASCNVSGDCIPGRICCSNVCVAKTPELQCCSNADCKLGKVCCEDQLCHAPGTCPM